MIWLNLIPKWAIGLALAVFVAMFAGQKIKNANLTLKVAQHETTIAQLKASISEGNALANARAQELEEAARVAEQDRARREKALAADARRALAGLRDALSKARGDYGLRANKESIAPDLDPADTVTELFLASVGRYTDLAEKCDRHVNDIKMMQEAWPK